MIIMSKTFIDSSINIFTNKEAEELLNSKNESLYYIKNVGIKKIPIQRWEEAQLYEKTTWCVKNPKLKTDRNEDHQTHFNDYKILNDILPHKKKINIIEIGCGPFTNLRLILQKLKRGINSIDLVDPLIEDYIKNCVYCSYKDNKLGNPVSWNVNIIKSTAEDLNINKKYDLIMMLNVLEHCYDIDKIFDNILSIMDKDSIFVYHDNYFINNIEEILNKIYDAGHPIKLYESYLNDWLKYFEIIYDKTFKYDDNRNSKYLILKKK